MLVVIIFLCHNTAMDFAKELKERCDKLGLTIAYLFKTAGVNRSVYYHWRTGRCHPKQITQLMLLETLCGFEEMARRYK